MNCNIGVKYCTVIEKYGFQCKIKFWLNDIVRKLNRLYLFT